MYLLSSFTEWYHQSMVQFDDASLALGAAAISFVCFLLSLYVIGRTKHGWFLKALYSIALLLCLVSLVAILGKPYTLTWSSVSRAVFLVDVSDSMAEAEAEILFDRAQELSSAFDEFEVLAFAGSTAQSPLQSFPSSYRQLKADFDKLDVGASNLVGVLSRSASLTASDVVLLSDGWETTGNAVDYLGRMSSSNQRVHAIIPTNDREAARPLSVSQLEAPLMQATGSNAAITFVTSNASTSSEQIEVTISRADEVVATEKLSIQPQSSERVSLKTDQLLEGPQEYTVDVKSLINPDYSISRSVFVSGTPREKVLLVSSDPNEAKILERVLRNQQFQLDSEIARSQFLSTAPDFPQYETVVFNNVPRTDFDNSMTSKLQSYVENGGTFIMVGGNKSFGLGGYLDTPVEDLLPVQIIPPQKKTKRLNVAVILLLDKSGSMRSEQKLDFAKLAAREVIRSLKDADYIGIIGVDDAPFITQQIGQLAQVRTEADRKVGLLYAVGGTNFLPAIDIAKRHLDKVQAGRKHVIMLTDGKLPDGFSMRPYYLQLVEDMRLSGTTLSTFLIGGEQGQLLREMANAGGGAFHRTRNAQTLPRLFLDDIRVSTGDRTQKESSQFKVTKAAPNSIVSTSLRDFPDLLGYTETRAKSSAQTELLVRDVRKADPLLASWNYKKGKVIAFTSDASGRWSKLWVGWNRFIAFWSEIIAPKPGDSDAQIKNMELDLTSQVVKGVLHLKLTAFADKPIGVPSGQLLFPDQSESGIVWKEVAPGYYETQVTQPMAGKYELKTTVDSTALTTLGFRLDGSLFGEQQDKGFNTPLLHKITSLSAGQINPSNSYFENTTTQTSTKEYIDEKIAALALIMLLLTIVARERLRRIGLHL